MSSSLSCLSAFLGPQVLSTLKSLLIYFIFVAIAVVSVRFIGPVSSLKELDYELREFIQYYKETAYWWLTTFFVSIIALTIGSGQHILVDMFFLSIFFLPAFVYYHNNSPFSLKCEYRARTSSGQTAISEEKENIATKQNGQYILELPITTGSNIDEFSITLEIPTGVAIWSHSSIKNVTVDEEKKLIEGQAPPGRDSFVVELILEEKEGVSEGGNLLVLSDGDTGRELTAIRLMPD